MKGQICILLSHWLHPSSQFHSAVGFYWWTKVLSAGDLGAIKYPSWKPGVDQNIALCALSAAQNSALLSSAFWFRYLHYFINPLLVFTRKVMSVMNSERDFHLWFDEHYFCPNITFAVEWPSDSKYLSQHLFIGSIVDRIWWDLGQWMTWSGFGSCHSFFFQFYVSPFRVAAAVVLHPWHVVRRNDTKDPKPFPSYLCAN